MLKNFNILSYLNNVSLERNNNYYINYICNMENLYTKEFYRVPKNTIQKFKDICDIVELNMMVEDSMKVYNKIEHRYTVNLS